MTVEKVVRVPEGSSLLAAFLEANGIGKRPAAEALGVSHPTVIAWLDGWKRPQPHLRVAIEAWTSGAVPASAWESEEEQAAAHIEPFKPTGTDGEG